MSLKCSFRLPGEGPQVAPFWTSCRVLLSALGFLGVINVYALRVNLSVAIVCMVNQTAVRGATGELGYGNGTIEPPEVAESGGMEGEFVWSKQLQGLVLGSFFWGYILTQIPGGWLAGRYGGKRVFGYFMLMTTAATLLTPVASRASPYLLMALRFIMGIGEGVVFPALTALWARWAPPLERSRLIGFTFLGIQVGTVLTFPISALLCEMGFAGGWPSIFYLFACYGMLWFVLWMALVADSPAQHPRITEAERRYIEGAIGATRTSPVNGLFSSLPYIAYAITSPIVVIIADKLIAKGIRVKVVRKVMFSAGCLGPGLFLIVMGHINTARPYLAVAMLTAAVGLCGFTFGGIVVNHVDIAPPFAGILFGMSNTAGTIPGFVAPYATGIMTSDQTQTQWQSVFYLAGAIYLAGVIMFGVFAEGTVLPWVKPYMFQEVENEAAEGVVNPGLELEKPESSQTTDNNSVVHN